MTKTMSFGYDGDRGLGDRLLAAVLRGEKTATSSLAVEYLSGEPLPRVGQRLTLVDHDGRAHGVVETTRVTIMPLHLVGDDVARDEGEGFARADEWRRDHVVFWNEVTDLVRADASDASDPPGSSVRLSPSSCTGFAWWSHPLHLLAPPECPQRDPVAGSDELRVNALPIGQPQVHSWDRDF